MNHFSKIILTVGFGVFTTSVVFAENEISEPVALDENAVVDSQVLETADGEEKNHSADSLQTKTTTNLTSKRTGEANPEKAEPLPEGATISAGERVAIDGKGFSIVAPQGWVVRKNLPRSSLFVQAQVPSSQYPRNITVVRFKDPKFISAVSAQEFADRLVASFPQVSSTIEGYSLRSHEPIKMADGREGWLFYTDFTDSGRKMMQAHVLVSSETNHYLATFTDIAEHFEGTTGGEQFLSEAWLAMTSIELDSPNPVQGLNFQMLIGSLLGLSLLIVISTVARKFFAKRHYRAMSDLQEFEDNTSDEMVSNHASLLTSLSPATSVAGASGFKAHRDSSSENIDDIVEETVRSGISRIIKFKAKKVSTTPDDEDLDFDTEKASKSLKRGA